VHQPGSGLTGLLLGVVLLGVGFESDTAGPQPGAVAKSPASIQAAIALKKSTRFRISLIRERCGQTLQSALAVHAGER
jgi:hypothetical protein